MLDVTDVGLNDVESLVNGTTECIDVLVKLADSNTERHDVNGAAYKNALATMLALSTTTNILLFNILQELKKLNKTKES